MTVFVGVDLAWAETNESGFCAFDQSGRVLALACACYTAAEMAAALDGFGPDVVVGIDAPLVVGPGRRAEADLARRLGPRGVYAHSAVAAVRNGYDAGVRLAATLQERGWSCDPKRLMVPRASGRVAVEVYPHAFHVVAFGLESILKYKQKKGRTVASLNVELGVYRGHLREVLDDDLPQLARDPSLVALLGNRAYTGRARKRHEDTVDALSCAVAAYLAWRDGIDPADVVGTYVDGYILIPGMTRFLGTTSGLAPSCP